MHGLLIIDKSCNLADGLQHCSMCPTSRTLPFHVVIGGHHRNRSTLTCILADGWFTYSKVVLVVNVASKCGYTEGDYAGEVV